jgi:hypothetical protein
VTDSNTAWSDFCAFAADPWARFSLSDFQEPWEVHTSPPKAKKTRQRKVTLDRAMRAASKAGVSVASATITSDGGVRLEIANGSNGHDINEWDSVQ